MPRTWPFAALLFLVALVPRVALAALWGPRQPDFVGVATFGDRSHGTITWLLIAPLARLTSPFVSLLFLVVLSSLIAPAAYFLTKRTLGKEEQAPRMVGLLVATSPLFAMVSAQGFVDPLLSFAWAALLVVVLAKTPRHLALASSATLFAVGLLVLIKPKILLVPTILYQFFTGGVPWSLFWSSLYLAGLFVSLSMLPIVLIVRRWPDLRRGWVWLAAGVVPLAVSVPVSAYYRYTEGTPVRGDVLRYSLPAIIPLTWYLLRDQKVVRYGLASWGVIVLQWLLMTPLFLSAPRWST